MQEYLTPAIAFEEAARGLQRCEGGTWRFRTGTRSRSDSVDDVAGAADAAGQHTVVLFLVWAPLLIAVWL